MSARARNSLSTCTHVAVSLLIVVKVNPTYIISMQLHDAFVSCSTFFGLLFCSAGLADPLLSKMARCGKTRTDSHICRNLHRTVRSFGKDLPVSITTVSTTHLRKKRKIPVQHPVLLPSNWAETIFNYGGHFLMQGKDLSDAGQFSQDLTDFWRNFCATHPDFKLPAAQWDHSIPICLHGDEGRGRLKHPVMVMSLQPLLPLRPGKTNMAGSFDSMIYSAYIPLQSFSLFCFFSGALGTLVYIKRGLTI